MERNKLKTASISKVLQRVVQPIVTSFTHPKIRHSRVAQPQLVAKSAEISASTLAGRIVVHERSAIRQAMLVAYMDGEVTIGSNTVLSGPGIDVFCHMHPVAIGNFCSIARYVVIQEYYHIGQRCSTAFIFQNVFRESMAQDITSKGAISIGHDVWIGTHSVILSGATIGNGAIIGANSVVNSSIPPYAIAAGTPARIVKYRFEPELIARLEELCWWDWSLERMRKNRSLFEGELTLAKVDGVME